MKEGENPKKPPQFKRVFGLSYIPYSAMGFISLVLFASTTVFVILILEIVSNTIFIFDASPWQILIAIVGGVALQVYAMCHS